MIETQRHNIPYHENSEPHYSIQDPIPLTIFTRAEIRKGCVWEIQLKFSPHLVQAEDLRSIYLEKPRGGLGRTEPYLCLKVRSKLIKPPKELPFTKVANIVSEGETIEVSEGGVATLKVKFTARPRAVFHKHSDMMILVVTLKRGENTICHDAKELIFRGGTGSIHSADQRHPPKREKKEMFKEETVESEDILPYERSFPEFEEFDQSKFCNDFLQSKGDFLFSSLGNTIETPTLDLIDQYDINPNQEWPTDFDNHIPTSLDTLTHSNSQMHPSIDMGVDLEQFDYTSAIPQSNKTQTFTVVYGKRRGACMKCKCDCSCYRGQGGQCNECGCFPTQHIDLDSPQKKRKLEDPIEERAVKRSKGDMETLYYQKLFFGCIHYLSLQELSTVCSKAPIPIFVKDENSVYIFMNSTFCNFVMDISKQERILNKSTSQILPKTEAQDIIKQEKYLLSQVKENTIKTFDVLVKRQNFRTMKQWTTLRDGKKVIVGIVISTF